MNGYVFLNDRLVESETAQINVDDAGLLHGVGLFETMRAYWGKLFRVEDHLERLYTSAKVLGIEIAHKPEDLADWLETLLEANGLKKARLRLTVTRGRLSAAADQMQSTLFATAAEMDGYPEEFYEKGMTVIVSSQRQNPTDPLAGHKTINYFGRLLGLQEAQQQRAGEALWFTTDGRLAEGCISNVFVVRDKELLTPPVDTPVLPGVTRKVVLELAETEGMAWAERPLTAEDMKAAREILLTNSIMELMPVCRIGREAVGDDRPGPVYRKLHGLYREAVEEACTLGSV
jgi:branched-chain amino acid aminotransferase